VILPLLAVLVCGIGCDEKKGTAASNSGQPNPATRPTTKPTLPVAPIQAAAVVPAVPTTSFLYLRYPENAEMPETVKANAAKASDWGIPCAFPQARLRLVSHGDEPVSAMLFSDDPKEAINKDWAGDRYYFQMPLQQITDLSHLDGAEWGVMASTSAADREETGNGLFLHGDRYHLEPINIDVHFDGTPGKPGGVQIRMAGQFLQYDSMNPSAQPTTVTVVGILMPRVETKD
jgi:hypothetical protein